MWFDKPWVGGENIMGTGVFKIPWVMGVKIPWVNGSTDHANEGVKIPWVAGSKHWVSGSLYHG